ncbi:hypothetical protein HDU98_002380, partial [Podochytrium sp. JEL0797]
ISSGWNSLASLTSLQGCPKVNDLFTLFLEQVECTDRALLKHSIIKSAAAKYKILNRCSVVDQLKAMEIVDQVQMKNKQSGAEIDELCALFWTQTKVTDKRQRESIFF